MLTNRDLGLIRGLIIEETSKIVQKTVVESENRTKKEIVGSLRPLILKNSHEIRKNRELISLNFKEIGKNRTLIAKIGQDIGKLWNELKYLRQGLNYTIDYANKEIISIKKHLSI